MSDPFGDGPFEKQVREELVRIGLGGGLDLGGSFTPQQLLKALRSTPDGAGAQVFMANLTAVLRRGSGE
ncbi:MAG TPA: hypothetical protein VK636_19730 [Gemmatimonadaceae bacterium]|nr:hypothetical protein [Gemmatimonadaceae bacterium]